MIQVLVARTDVEDIRTLVQTRDNFVRISAFVLDIVGRVVDCRERSTR